MTVVVRIPTELSDGTIAIRTHQPSDIHPYFEAARESIAEVSRHLLWLHQEYSIEEARTWLRSAEREPRQVGSGQMLNDALLATYITEL